MAEEQLILPLLATYTPDGSGGWTVKPMKPQAEVGPEEAAKILGCSRSHLNNIVEFYDQDNIIQWRWLGVRGSGGKRLYLVESLEEYKDSLRETGTVELPFR